MPNSDCYVPDFMQTCRNSIEIKQADENKIFATPSIMMRAFEVFYFICY